MTLDDLGDCLFADVPQAAAILGLDPRTVRRAAEAGEIPAHKVSNKWRIPTSWLREQAGMSAETIPVLPDLDQLADLVADRLFARFVRLFGGASGEAA